MKRYWIGALVIALALIVAQGAIAAGNFYIPGSRDLEGGIGKDGKSFLDLNIGNRITFEGSTSDAYEATIVIPDPGSDITYTFPSASGTLMTTGGAGSLTDSTNTNILISNGTIFQSKTVSGLATISNTGALTGTLADTKLWIGNSGGAAVAVTMSGDATITNAGAMTLAANSVSVSQAFINTVTLMVAKSTTYNTVTVDSGHQFLGYYLSTVGGINGLNLVNAPTVSAGVWKIAMVNAPSAHATYTLVFLSDN